MALARRWYRGVIVIACGAAPLCCLRQSIRPGGAKPGRLLLRPRGLPLAADTDVLPGARDGRDVPLRMMAVHAHPDDESSKGAATMARYIAGGAQVMVATL